MTTNNDHAAAVELWEAIPGYEGAYEVSSLGNVRSLDRFVVKVNGSKRFYKGRMLSPSSGGTGYPSVCLSKDNKPTSLNIHRLVAEVFIACNRGGQLYVNHINGIKDDNRVANLEWCTPSENSKHAYSIGLRPKRFGAGDQRGSANFQSKLNEIQVRIIKRLVEIECGSAREIGDLFGVGSNLVYNIANGVKWKHLTQTGATQ